MRVPQTTYHETNVQIDPNPARDFVNIVYDFPDVLCQEFSIQIYDATGRKVYEEVNPDSRQEIRIELKGYSPGTYTLRLLGDGNTLARRKLSLIQ